MPDVSSDLLLEVRDLKLHFFADEGVVKALDGISYTIQRGKTLCVVGESGSGKSVAARAILQIVHKPGKIVAGQIVYHKPLPQGGKETIEITALAPRSSQIRAIRGKEISMIFQEPMTSLSALYTVGNQIMETIRLHEDVSKAEARNRAIEMLRRVGIPKPERRVDEYPFRLSGGMRQRCMIAMALSCNPQLLIADEPTTALDVTTQAQILDLMRELQEDYGMAILFITHDLGVVAEIADDVAVMYLGTVVERCDVDTLFNNPAHPYTKALLKSIPKITPERQHLNAIRGSVPNPFNRPRGCPFHPRCDHVMDDLCRQAMPVTIQLSPHHQASCWLYDSVNDREQPAPPQLSKSEVTR
ncbi:MAG: ABC transporter ATP-binding protein [Anaerolineae bacterium]|nr:ABC transporter ATP-binding protein [Anaerolineae bacterium]